MKLLLLPSLLLLAWTAPGAAASASADAPVLEIPFAPPTDRPIRYEVVTEKESDGKATRVTLEQEHVYHRQDGGYLVTITNISASDGTTTLRGGTDEARLLASPIDIFAPLTLELDADGVPVRVADWETQRAKLAQAPALVVALRPGADSTQSLAVANRAIEPFLRATAEEAVELLVRHWPSVMGWGGTAYVQGEVNSYAGEVPSPVTGAMLPQEGTVVFDRGDHDEYTIALSESTDPEALREAIVSYLSTLGEAGDPKYDAMMAAVRRDLTVVHQTNSMELAISPDTGLVETATVERRFEFAIGVGFERGIIRRID